MICWGSNVQTNQECPTTEKSIKSINKYKQYWAHYQHLLQKVQRKLHVSSMYAWIKEWGILLALCTALFRNDVGMFASLAQSLTRAAPPRKQQYSMWRRSLKRFREEVNTAAFLNTVYRCTWSNSTWGLFSSPPLLKVVYLPLQICFYVCLPLWNHTGSIFQPCCELLTSFSPTVLCNALDP